MFRPPIQFFQDWLSGSILKHESSTVRLRKAVDRTAGKHELTVVQGTTIFRSRSPTDVRCLPPRFEELCSDLLERVKTPVQTALSDAKLSIKDIQEVVLVGGR